MTVTAAYSLNGETDRVSADAPTYENCPRRSARALAPEGATLLSYRVA